jgi:hypothetical protein
MVGTGHSDADGKGFLAENLSSTTVHLFLI